MRRSQSLKAGRWKGEPIELDEFTEKEGVGSAARGDFTRTSGSNLLLNTNLHPFRGGSTELG